MERLFNWQDAFDFQPTRYIVLTLLALLTVTPVVYLILDGLGRLSSEKRKELWLRWGSWVGITSVLIGPILLGPLATMLGVMLLSLFCFREYARATGLFRERLLSVAVVVSIFFLTFTIIDNWYFLFLALVPLSTVVIATAGIVADRPKGYIQRVALAVFGYIFFGVSFGHLGYIANEPNYRAILLMILVTVSLNDVFAYIAGHAFGKRKLIPNTSPNKTLEGAIGSIIGSCCLVFVIGRAVFESTALDNPLILLLMGLIISTVGMLGDLLISSIKRDLGLKDIGTTIPGHGGLLDRFDSLILVAPCIYHLVNYYLDIGESIPARILSGGGL